MYEEVDIQEYLHGHLIVLSRNAGDLGSVVDLMDENKLIEIRTYGQHFKNSPNEKFLLMILCSQAKLENDNKSINVKRG
jgi:DNA invertase Pin-like site-specific DNA recombinase